MRTISLEESVSSKFEPVRAVVVMGRSTSGPHVTFPRCLVRVTGYPLGRRRREGTATAFAAGGSHEEEGPRGAGGVGGDAGLVR
ncbi:hypothetical protein GCM10025883_10790 [Mobilicoccus caccae]|uniref:Uncharacterized protein n=1 Tax=Mobilicoccus caccae TaxID=1859295 RepID=A0ABQ6INK2_9MICO|nr:hypothetical protein GCM10025883_10790 [Mobilicoccus caccae]